MFYSTKKNMKGEKEMKKNMKHIGKMLIVAGLMATLLVPYTSNANSLSSPSPEQPKERFLVTFKDDVADSTKKHKSVEKVKGKVSQQFKNFNGVVAEMSEDMAESLKNDPSVLDVEIDRKIEAYDYMDWGLSKVNAPTAWNVGYTGKGVKVAIIDTGIATHPDLVVSGGVSTVGYTTSYEDDQGHGTHVAGIIGAKNNGIGTVGTAPDAQIFAVKALDNTGSGYLSDIVEGIDWAVANKMDIVNMSLGTSSPSTALEKAVNNAYNQGVLVVAAAGNSGKSTVDYPAKYSGAIAVSAVDSNLKKATFSSYGKEVFVAAPGVDITSTYLNGQYAKMSGTSMATPYTVGTLALIKEKNPLASASQLRSILEKTAQDLGTKGRDTSFGYGLAQAPTTK